jgi:Cu(I)/Ag(I) efflux system membrane fusion protein
MKYLTSVTLTLLTGILGLLLTSGCGRTTDEESEVSHSEHRSESAENRIVHLDKHKVFHAGMQVEAVQKKSVAIPLTLPGKVSFNDRKLAHITARVSGRVENVYALINEKVSTGEVLMELFSQEFLSMQSEFLQAAERFQRSERSGGNERSTAQSIYESAKRKLLVVGVTEDDLREIESRRTPKTYLPVRAPFTGTIIENSVRQGAAVQTGSELYELADLSTLWVLADIYEKDLPRIWAGMNASAEVNAYPGELFEGQISTVYGVLDERTRTVKARIEVRNKNGRLKPEMFCNVHIQTELGKETIKIPASALLGETEKHFVFVALNDTTFEKRDVRTGVETREFAEILDGLLVGEKIVVKGGFFLKSELAKETFGEEH